MCTNIWLVEEDLVLFSFSFFSCKLMCTALSVYLSEGLSPCAWSIQPLLLLREQIYTYSGLQQLQSVSSVGKHMIGCYVGIRGRGKRVGWRWVHGINMLGQLKQLVSSASPLTCIIIYPYCMVHTVVSLLPIPLKQAIKIPCLAGSYCNNFSGEKDILFTNA